MLFKRKGGLMVKGLVIGDKIIPSDSILSIEMVQSSLTKNWQVLLAQTNGLTVLFVSPAKATAKEVYDALIAGLYEPVDMTTFVTPALSHTVKIYDDISVLKTETVQDTDSWTIPDLTKEGYTLEGVYTDQAMTSANKIVGGKVAIHEDTNLYSKWTQNPPAAATLSADEPQDNVETTTVNVPPVKKTRTRKVQPSA